MDQRKRLGLRCDWRNPGLETTKNLEAKIRWPIQPILARNQLRLHGDWRPKIRNLWNYRSPGELLWGDSDDRKRRAIDLYDLPNGLRISAEFALPECMAQHNDRFAPGALSSFELNVRPMRAFIPSPAK